MSFTKIRKIKQSILSFTDREYIWGQKYTNRNILFEFEKIAVDVFRAIKCKLRLPLGTTDN